MQTEAQFRIIDQTRKNLTWTEKEIRESTPEILMNLIDTFRDFLENIIKDSRMSMVANPDQTKFYEGIFIEWGKWSHSFNKVIRGIIQAGNSADATATPEERFLNKKYIILYLYWWKSSNYLEVVNAPFIFNRYQQILETKNLMHKTKEYFTRMKLEELPSWLQVPGQDMN